MIDQYSSRLSSIPRRINGDWSINKISVQQLDKSGFFKTNRDGLTRGSVTLRVQLSITSILVATTPYFTRRRTSRDEACDNAGTRYSAISRNVHEVLIIPASVYRPHSFARQWRNPRYYTRFFICFTTRRATVDRDGNPQPALYYTYDPVGHNRRYCTNGRACRSLCSLSLPISHGTFSGPQL